MTTRDILMREDLALTPSEMKIIRLLLADYPMAGLGTAANLGKQAGVSGPTVVRLIMKLGFDGFAEFQSRLLADIETRLHSPLQMMETKRLADDNDSTIVAYLKSVAAAHDKCINITPPLSYDKAARLIMAAKGSVIMLGGRFSRYVAGMLASYVSQFRPGVRDLETLSGDVFDTLADLGKHDVLVVFDYRRYQLDVVAYAQQAAQRGVRIVLFTDQWLSPIAEHAEVTIIAPLEVRSPYDSLAPAVAQMGALVVQIISSMSPATRARIEELEEIRSANAVTLDSPRDKLVNGGAASAQPPKTRNSKKKA